MKSTTLLESQHRNIRQLCQTIELGSPSIRESLLPQLANDLVAHLRIENELFYPTARRVLGETAHDDEARRRRTQERVDSLLDLAPGDGAFEGLAAELRELLDAHIHEEEDHIFPVLERTMSPAENRALAERMMLLHHASVEAGYERASLFPPPPARSPAPRAVPAHPHR